MLSTVGERTGNKFVFILNKFFFLFFSTEKMYLNDLFFSHNGGENCWLPLKSLKYNGLQTRNTKTAYKSVYCHFLGKKFICINARIPFRFLVSLVKPFVSD